MSQSSPFLPHLPHDLLAQRFKRASGNEFDSGKLFSLESSASIVANAFGAFIERPGELPPLPGMEDFGWPAVEVDIERPVRFPWRGGRHPWLDAFVETQTHIIGIESKRYEPFRASKATGLSDAYWRDVWGDEMAPFKQVRDELRAAPCVWSPLDAGQLIKHAFALRTEGRRRTPARQAVLVYLFAEPARWASSGRPVSQAALALHASTVTRFATAVAGAEVVFRILTYRALLAEWGTSNNAFLVDHATAFAARFPDL